MAKVFETKVNDDDECKNKTLEFMKKYGIKDIRFIVHLE